MHAETGLRLGSDFPFPVLLGDNLDVDVSASHAVRLEVLQLDVGIEDGSVFIKGEIQGPAPRRPAP